MSTITKEQLRERARQKVKSLELAVTQSAFADSRAELEEELELARIALASLEEGNELQRKAEIHDDLCKKYNVESLADFVDWQRNHIAELEAAPPAPVGPGETAVMPDYQGYTMTQRECFQAGKKAGLAEAVNSQVIPGAYDIETFGIFSATESESGLMFDIERFRFGVENCPKTGKVNRHG